MSKSRKRLRKAAMLGIGLLGASKLMGMKADLASKALKGDQYAKAKKAFTANRAYSGAKPLLKDKGIAEAAVTTLKRSDLPAKRNMKSIFVQDDGSIWFWSENFSWLWVEELTRSKGLYWKEDERSWIYFPHIYPSNQIFFHYNNQEWIKKSTTVDNG